MSERLRIVLLLALLAGFFSVVAATTYPPFHWTATGIVLAMGAVFAVKPTPGWNGRGACRCKRCGSKYWCGPEPHDCPMCGGTLISEEP